MFFRSHNIPATSHPLCETGLAFKEELTVDTRMLSVASSKLKVLDISFYLHKYDLLAERIRSFISHPEGSLPSTVDSNFDRFITLRFSSDSRMLEGLNPGLVSIDSSNHHHHLHGVENTIESRWYISKVWKAAVDHLVHRLSEVGLLDRFVQSLLGRDPAAEGRVQVMVKEGLKILPERY